MQARGRAVPQRLRTVLEWVVGMVVGRDTPDDRVGPLLKPEHTEVRHTVLGAASL